MKNFNYFYNSLGLSPSNFALYYDFNEGINPVPSVSGANPQFSGIVSNITNFYQNNGSGFFSGSNIQISNASGLNSTNFTVFFVYQKPNAGNGVLYSTLNSGAAVPSGFIIGINDANRLYFEAYDQTGPVIYSSSNIIGSKNAIAIVKSNNTLNFHYYNFNYQSLESEQFNISPTAFYQSNQAYLAAPVNAPAYITQNAYTGYMDQFLYLNNALTPNVISKLCSGFYVSKNPSSTGFLVQYNTNLPGGIIVNTGVGTGITGFQVFQAGIALDNCGNSYPIYSYNNAIGTILQDVFVPLLGAATYTVTGLIDNGYFTDTGYCAGFGMNGVSYIRSIMNDYQELYTSSQIGITGLNLTANFNLDGNFKLDTNYTNNQLNIYVNGICDLGSGTITSGNGFINTLFLLGDYFVSGQSVNSTGAYKSTDRVSYDSISGITELYLINNSGAQSFATTNVNNRLVFLNGQKLVSGLDYIYTSTNLNILGIVATGRVTTEPAQSGTNYFSGKFATFQTGKFMRDTAELWMNGQKQILGLDYIEISNIDLLSGSGLFNNIQNSIYNTNTQFLEKF